MSESGDMVLFSMSILFGREVAFAGLDELILVLRSESDLVISVWACVRRGIAELVLQTHLAGDLGIDLREGHVETDGEDTAAGGFGQIVEHAYVSSSIAVIDGVDDNVGTLRLF